MNYELNKTYATESGSILYGDYNALLCGIPDGGVDTVFTDPAYWTLDKHRSIGTTTRLGGGLDGESDADKFFETISKDDLWELVWEFGRILPTEGIAWVMCDNQTALVLGGMCHEAIETDEAFPFTYCKQFPVIKRAMTGGLKSGMGYHGRCCHEYVLLLQKNKNVLTEKTNWNDVFDTGLFEEIWDGSTWSRQYTPDGKPYPTAKPLPFIERLIELSTPPGGTVCDPFAGSGSTAVAAIRTGRRYLTCDHSLRSIQTVTAAIEAQLNPHAHLNTGLFAGVAS